LRLFLLITVMFMSATQAAEETSVRLTTTAKQWGLSDTEYRQYQTVMAGPRGIWSPDLDPLMALGVTANTAAERRRYAELYVRQEYARVERELAFQREISAAWVRLFPGQRRIAEPAALERYALVIDARQDNSAVVSDYTSRGEAGVDLYLVGSDNLAEWIRLAGIPDDKIQSSRVSVKSGASFADLDHFPVIFIKREGQGWVPQA
jgi:integrating conjugative element protein (TIGR03759 family)